MNDQDLEKILDRVQSWGMAADNTVNGLTAIQAAVFAFLLPKLGEWIQNPAASVWMKIFLVVAVIGRPARRVPVIGRWSTSSVTWR